MPRMREKAVQFKVWIRPSLLASLKKEALSRESTVTAEIERRLTDSFRMISGREFLDITKKLNEERKQEAEEWERRLKELECDRDHWRDRAERRS
jgi:hypothetical protein